MGPFSTRARILAGVACAFIVAPAFAQDAAPAAEDQSNFQEIVVTAQKRAENLQDVPIAVTALAGDQLTAAGVQGQIDLPKLTPNLNFTVNSSFASAYIRGVGTQFGNPGLESSVSVYLDDVYVPRASAALFGFGDVERIEVLKGPQGTLYGRNATGGAIRIITNDPKSEFGARARVTVGSFATRTVDGMVNVPLGEGIAFRLSGRHDENKGYVKNLAPNGGSYPGMRRMQDRNEDMIMGKLVIESGDFKLKVSGDWSKKDDNESVAEANLFPGGPEQMGMALGGCGSAGFYTLCNDGYGYITPTAWGIAVRADYDVGPATISSITAYRSEKETNCADIDGTGAPLQPVCGQPYTKQWTQELQIASNGKGPLRYVAGVYYLREHSGYPFTVIVDTVNNYALQSTGEGMRAQSLAPFAQVDWDITDQFALSGGIRYTVEDKKLLGNGSLITPYDPATGQPLAYGSQTGLGLPECTPTSAPATCYSYGKTANFKKLTWKLTASYKPVDDVMLYATWSRGFKSGGLNLPAFAFVDTVAPEVLDDYEIGWKAEFGSIRWNGAAFYYDYQDLQISITDQSTGGTRIKNAAGATIKGVESDLTWAPSRQFELGVGGALLDTKYKNFIGDAYIPCGDVPGLPTTLSGYASAVAQCTGQGGLGLALVSGLDLSGKKLVNAPKFSGYIRAQFTQEMEGIGKFVLGGVANYRSVAYFDSANNFNDPKRLTLSAKLTWTSPDDHYTLAVSGENLSNKKFLTIKSPQNLGGWRIVGQPRWFYFSAGVNF